MNAFEKTEIGVLAFWINSLYHQFAQSATIICSDCRMGVDIVVDAYIIEGGQACLPV